jgi:hypothetical protein
MRGKDDDSEEEEFNRNHADDLDGTFNDRDSRVSPDTHHAKRNMP